MGKKRSVGIIVFSIFFMLIGLLFVLAMPLFSILYLVTGIGIILLKPYARFLAITVSTLGLIVNTMKVVSFMQKTDMEAPLSVLVLTYLFHLGVIFYFTRPKVKEQFKS